MADNHPQASTPGQGGGGKRRKKKGGKSPQQQQQQQQNQHKQNDKMPAAEKSYPQKPAEKSAAENPAASTPSTPKDPQGQPQQKKGQDKSQGQAASQSQKQPESQAEQPQKQSQPQQGQPKGQKPGPGQPPKKSQPQGESQKSGQAQGQAAAPYQPDAEGGAAPAQKSKAQLRAERRALQEAQRAAKMQAKEATGGGKKGAEAGKKGEAAPQPPKKQDSSGGKGEGPRVPDMVQLDDAKTRKRIEKNLEKQRVPARSASLKQVGLFSHLPQYERQVSLTTNVKFTSSAIHPAILKLGVQYAEGVICGSNARCIALLSALNQVISDYTTPPQKELCRDLEAKIKPCISFLTQCRPMSVSMGNAIKLLKWHITHIPSTMSDTQAKKQLYDEINSFVHERIILAGKAISEFAQNKIKDGDVIMVYACSSLILRVLHDAHSAGVKFRVIVVDGRPKLEGREMLRRLVKHGIKCSYVLVNAVSYVIKHVTKVLLGAHALLANGYVMSRVGSSQVALIAKSCNVPVLVCCETYKFCERVQTDSFVFNELGDPDDLTSHSKKHHLDNWKDQSALNLLNLTYDVTAPDFVTMVITELGMLPCTSVPVVLRVTQSETEV